MSKSAVEALSVVVERDIPFPPEKIWRALTQPHLIEEWLMKNDFKPVVEHRFQPSRRLGRRRLSGPGSRAEQNAVLHLGRLWPGERGNLDAHPDGYGDAPAHGTVGLPARPAAGLPGRQARVAAVLWDAGAGRGADRLKSAGALKPSLTKKKQGRGPCHELLSMNFFHACCTSFSRICMGGRGT